MVRTRVEVGADPRRDGGRVAVHDERVDQRVAAAVGEVGVRPAQPPEVGRVVAQVQVGTVDGGPAERARRDRVGVEHHLLLGSEQRALPEDLAGEARVRRRGEVGVRARRALGGEGEHLRPERGEHPVLDGHALGVEDVEVVDDRVVRAAVLLRGLGMADADAEQEAAGVDRGDPVVRRRDLGGGRAPHVHDARGDGEAAGGVEQLLGEEQVRGRGPADPHRAVAERLDLLRQARGELVATPPDPDAAQFDGHVGANPPARPRIPVAGGRRGRGAGADPRT